MKAAGQQVVTPDDIERQTNQQWVQDHPILNGALNFTGGAKQAIEGAAGSAIGSVLPRAGQAMQADAAATDVDPNSWLTSAGRFTGGAIASSPTMLGPEAMAATGAVEGVGQGRIDAANLRDQGRNISGTQEALDAAGQGLIGAASGFAQGKLIPERGQAVSNIGTGVAGMAAISQAEQVARNAVRRWTIDPNQPYTQGASPQAALGAGVQQGIFTGGHEAWKAFDQRAEQQYQTYRARPRPDNAQAAPVPGAEPPPNGSEAAARQTLGIDPSSDLYPDDIKNAYRKTVSVRNGPFSHPDAGGTDAGFKQAMAAREYLESLYGNKVRPANTTQQTNSSAAAAAGEPSAKTTTVREGSGTAPAARPDGSARPETTDGETVPAEHGQEDHQQNIQKEAAASTPAGASGGTAEHFTPAELHDLLVSEHGHSHEQAADTVNQLEAGHAASQGQQSQGDIQQHPGADENRQVPAEAGGGDSLQRGTAQQAPRKVGPYSLAGIRQRLLDLYDENGGAADEQARDAHQQQAEDEARGYEHLWYPANTRSGYPNEIEDNFTPAEMKQLQMRRLIAHPEPGQPAHGEDAMHAMGQQAYVSMLRSKLQDTDTFRLEQARKMADGGYDPRMQFLQALHDEIQDTGKRAPKGEIATDDLPAGSTFSVMGHKYTVHDEGGGFTVAKDDEFPEIPLAALDKIPVDKGSVIASKSAPAESIEGIAARAHAPQTGIFGQGVISETPLTGSQMTMNRFMDHRPTEYTPPVSSNETDAKMRQQYKDDAAPEIPFAVQRRRGYSVDHGSTAQTRQQGSIDQERNAAQSPSTSARGIEPGTPEHRAAVESAISQLLGPDHSVRKTADGWLIQHPNGTLTRVRYVEQIPQVPDPGFAASLIAHDGGNTYRFPDEGDVAVPKTLEEYNALPQDTKDFFRREWITNGKYDPRTGEVHISSQAADPLETVREELYHRAFAQLAPADKQMVYDLYPGESRVLAEEKAFQHYVARPRIPFDGEEPGQALLRGMAKWNTFRTGGSGDSHPRRPGDKRGGYVALPNLSPMVQEARAKTAALRSDFRPLAIRFGDKPAELLNRMAVAPALTNSIEAAFRRQAFGNDLDLYAKFIELGEHFRGEEMESRGRDRNNLPELTPREVVQLMNNPKIQRAIDIYNKEIAPFIDDIRTRNKMPMNKNAGSIPFFLNLVTDFDRPHYGGESAAAFTKPFSKQASGGGTYEDDPIAYMRRVIGGHVRADANLAFKNWVKSSGLPFTKITPEKSAGEPTQFMGMWNGKKVPMGVVDLNQGLTRTVKDTEGNSHQIPLVEDPRYIPKPLADKAEGLRNAVAPSDDLLNYYLGAATKVGLTLKGMGHVYRNIAAVAARGAQQAPQGWGSIVQYIPSWLGNKSLAIKRMMGMAGTPLGDAMQIGVDSSGAPRGAGYGIPESHTLLSKALNITHQAIMHPVYGADPNARRELANLYYRMAFGHEAVNAAEGRIAADGANKIGTELFNKLTPAQRLDMGRFINSTMGYLYTPTRSTLINKSTHFLPFVGTESGMIPNELQRFLTANVSIPAAAKTFQRGQYLRGMAQLAGQLASGALGAYLLANGLNYASSKINGHGRFMWDNDEGHKFDVQLPFGGERPWYVSNLAPDIARAARLSGVKAAVNKEIHSAGDWLKTIGREGGNEIFSALNPGISSAITAMIGKELYWGKNSEQYKGSVSDNLPLIGHTAHGYLQGNGASEGAARDAASLAGLNISRAAQPSTEDQIKELESRSLPALAEKYRQAIRDGLPNEASQIRKQMAAARQNPLSPAEVAELNGLRKERAENEKQKKQAEDRKLAAVG